MLELNFDPFPRLHSERLDFRALEDSDVSQVFELRSDVFTMQYIPRPLAKTQDDALKHIHTVKEIINKKEGLNWAITLKGKDTLIGIIGFYRIKPESYRTELGYMLLPAYQNQGYISEAIRTILIFAFDTLKFNSIEAIIDPRNAASERVLLKNGFVKEAHIRENEFWNGEFLDTVIYSVLSREFNR